MYRGPAFSGLPQENCDIIQTMSVGEPVSVDLRILFFGLPAGVSAMVLAGLLADGVTVAGVVVPARAVPHLLPVEDSPWVYLKPHGPAGLTLPGNSEVANTLGVAWAAGVPVLAVSDFDNADTLAALTTLHSDVAVVACFTQRIPDAVLRQPRYGFLNIHPSLLPAYRGPTPVFWQLRDGAETGVTVHALDEGLDTGDIAAQRTTPLTDGITEAQAEQRLMQVGLELLVEVLGDTRKGVMRRRPQPSSGSYFGFPTEADFTLSTEWPARRAYNFMRATVQRGLPYRLEIAGKAELLASADHYEADLVLDRPSVRHGRHIIIHFNPGILYARLAYPVR